MGSPLLIGLGAGLVAAVLFTSALSGQAASFILVCLTPLPIYLAGFGWGVTAAATCSAAGMVFVALTLGPLAASGFAVEFALPGTLLCYLASLRREVASNDPNDTAKPAVEWYPVSRIIMWAAILAAVIAAINILTMGQDEEAYRSYVENNLAEKIIAQLPPETQTSLSKEQIKALNDLAVEILPATVSMGWLILTCANMWAGMRIAQISGRLARPPLTLSGMQYPRVLGWAFVVSILASWTSGMFGIIATAFVGSFFVAYLLLGLVIIHAILPQSPSRPLILSGVYAALIILGWPGLFIALVGLADPATKLREKFSRPKRPPGPD